MLLILYYFDFLFQPFQDVRAAPSRDVEEAIREGGLAEVKVQRIKAILDTLINERGECSMEYVIACLDMSSFVF